MRFLRMLTNALFAGALGAGYLTVLVLQLNPQVPALSATTGLWFGTLALFYGASIALFFYALMLTRDFFGLDALSPGWISVRVLAWLAAVLSAGAAVLMWLNAAELITALDDAAAWRMRVGAIAVAAAAIVLLAIAVAHYSFGRRGSRVGAALFALAVFASLALPLAARGPASAPPRTPAVTPGVPPPPALEPRVLMVLLDGASLEYIWSRAAEGRLQHFARLLESGATLDLATVRPTGPGPVWASVATGKYPAKHGIRSGVWYYVRGNARGVDLLPNHCFSHALVRLGVVRQTRTTSAAWRARPLWEILSGAGIPVGIVRWPLTYPAQPVLGFSVSDRLHEFTEFLEEPDERAVFPADALAVARAEFLPREDSDVLRLADRRLTSMPSPREMPAAMRDARYSEAMRQLQTWSPVRFAAIRYQVLDTIGHLYSGDVHPGGVSDVPGEERRRHVQLLDRYYAYLDDEIGTAMEALAPGDLLLVVSGFGMARQPLIKQIAGRLFGDPQMTGTHERAPDGFLLAYGTTVESGRHPRGSIVDVAPTILYFLGLPIGRDMDGYARTDLFERGFTSDRPITFIPTYGQ